MEWRKGVITILLHIAFIHKGHITLYTYAVDKSKPSTIVAVLSA